jgi:outer membrane protein OmpA-like peptidoglycan-associated protein
MAEAAPAQAPQPAPEIVTPAPPPAVTVQAMSPPTMVKADIARAQSGEVPPGAVKSLPFGGPMQVAVVQFGRGSSGLAGTSQGVIADVARMYKLNGGTVRVVAHASEDVAAQTPQALEQGNYEVSRRRALAITSLLMTYGVPRGSIVAEAASDAEPAFGTNTARGVAANRRAEVFLDL